MCIQLNTGLPPGIDLVAADNFDEWLLDIRVLDDNPIYRDQIYRLKFKFTRQYPIGTPSLPAPSCSRAPRAALVLRG